MKKIINIKTNNAKFYSQWLTLLSTLSPWNNLQPKERELVALLSSLDNKYKDLDIQEKADLILSKTNRESIMNTMNISNKQVFNNLLSSLRKKGVMKDNILSNYYVICPDKNNQLIFNFNYED